VSANQTGGVLGYVSYAIGEKNKITITVDDK
jgi:hypothetical protein